MEWNQLLLWIAGASTVMSLLRLLKSPIRQGGWIGVCLVLLAITAAALVLVPDFAGFIAGAAWGLLLLAPSMLFRRVQRAVANMDFDRAAALANIARWMHPLDGWWQQPRMCRGFAAAQRGDLERSMQLFEPLRRLRTTAGLTAELQIRRLQQDWMGIITTLQQKGGRVAQHLPILLRALGELGHPDAMVIAYLQERPVLQGEGLATVHATARWMLLAFTGRTATLEDLFSHHFPKLPPPIRRLWIARSALVAGRREWAIAELQALTAESPGGPEGGVAIDAQAVLDHLPPPLLLLPANEMMLEQIDNEVRHDAAYTVAIHGVRRRPWLTWILIAANCVMFAVELAMGEYKGDDQTLMDLFVRLGAAVAIPGEPVQWWRAITANFLHFGFAHLLMNMLALYVLGPFIEQFLGRGRYLILYTASGIGAVAGVMGWWLIHPPKDAGFLVGASGAIMGLIGANGAILLRGWLRDRAAVAARRLRTILLIVAVQVVFDQLTPQVSGAAHMIGLVIGFIVTLLLMMGMGKRVFR